MDAPRFVKPGFGHAMRVWWSFTWRSILLFMVPVLGLGLIFGIFVALAKPEQGTALRIYGFLMKLSLPILFWAQFEAIRRVLKLDYRGFSVRLVERPPQ